MVGVFGVIDEVLAMMVEFRQVMMTSIPELAYCLAHCLVGGGDAFKDEERRNL